MAGPSGSSGSVRRSNLRDSRFNVPLTYKRRFKLRHGRSDSSILQQKLAERDPPNSGNPAQMGIHTIVSFGADKQQLGATWTEAVECGSMRRAMNRVLN